MSQLGGFEAGEPGCSWECQCRPLQPPNCTPHRKGSQIWLHLQRTHPPFSREALEMGRQWHICCPHSRWWEFLLPSLAEGFTFRHGTGCSTVRLHMLLCRLLSVLFEGLLCLGVHKPVSLDDPMVHVVAQGRFWQLRNSDPGEHPWNQIKSVQYSNNSLHLYSQTSVIMLSPLCF